PRYPPTQEPRARGWQPPPAEGPARELGLSAIPSSSPPKNRRKSCFAASSRPRASSSIRSIRPVTIAAPLPSAAIVAAIAGASAWTCRKSRCASKTRATARADAKTLLSVLLPVAGTRIALIIGFLQPFASGYRGALLGSAAIDNRRCLRSLRHEAACESHCDGQHQVP